MPLIKRRIWIAGLVCTSAVIPAALLSVLLFGCCVLPFHRIVHRYLPMCGGIVKLWTGESHREAAPAKVVPGKAPAPLIVAARITTPISATVDAIVPRPSPRLRDRIAHGALRCDDDVGLLPLLSLMLV